MCSLTGIDCCNTPHQIVIGISEAIKIHNETGLKYSEFCNYVTLGKEQFEDAFQKLLPNGKAIAMKKNTKGSCYFFAENGCTIPQLRPNICRVFPIWYDQELYNANHTITLFIEERDCLIRKKMQEFQDFKDACMFVGTTEDDLKIRLIDFIREMESFRSYEYLFESMYLDSALARIQEAMTSHALFQVELPLEKPYLQI